MLESDGGGVNGGTVEAEVAGSTGTVSTSDARSNSGAEPASVDALRDMEHLGRQLHSAQRELAALRRENEGYKRRAEEERRAQLTEEQRIREERDGFESRTRELEAKIARLGQERLMAQIATEFKLPASLAVRLQGTDEESLRADAAELARLLPKPRVGAPTAPVMEAVGGKRIYDPKELEDRVFFKANEADIRLAAKEGRIRKR